MSRKYLIIALALPLLAIGAAILRAELSLERASDFVFEIEGYDPRDLLRGHYLQFRLRVDPVPVREPCDDASGQCCLCLTRVAASEPPRAERTSCATARAVCDGALHTRYLNQSHRYYVPEAQAAALERRLIEAMQRRKAEVVLAIDETGQARVRELRIDGRAIPGRAAGSD